MYQPAATMLRIGAWSVNPTSAQMSRDGETVRVEARTMRLLLCLAEHTDEVVSIDQLLNQVWPDVTVSPDSVYQAVASLRRLLGDDPKNPAYIATVPRLGYRMVASVSAEPTGPTGSRETSRDSEGQPSATATERQPGTRRVGLILVALAGLTLAVLIAFMLHNPLPSNKGSSSSALALQSEKSVAVLPFLDLTQAMTEEPFADGMTEELIDKLSKIPGLKVPAPTSSFYFKGKNIPLADIAKTLGVAYVLDGSVRKSGTRLRVAARLVRADSGYVVWSETYDRPFDDILKLQDEIADQVTKALQASIKAYSGAVQQRQS
jgi:TolB-like protein/DNA-binding winged helix-turn-helix (wHTH) protein